MNQKVPTFTRRLRNMILESGMDYSDMADAVAKVRGKPYTVGALAAILDAHDKPVSRPGMKIIEDYAEALGVEPGVLTGDVE
jgi:hypothetical protein